MGINTFRLLHKVFHWVSHRRSIDVKNVGVHSLLSQKYNHSTGGQIVLCILSSDSVLSESAGLLNPVLCVSQLNIFWQKISQSHCVFQLLLGLEKNYSPSPLGDFNKLSEGQIGVLFKIWHWNMISFFQMASMWLLKCKFVPLLCW